MYLHHPSAHQVRACLRRHVRPLRRRVHGARAAVAAAQPYDLGKCVWLLLLTSMEFWLAVKYWERVVARMFLHESQQSVTLLTLNDETYSHHRIPAHKLACVDNHSRQTQGG